MNYQIRVYRNRHEFPFPIPRIFLTGAIHEARQCIGAPFCAWWSVSDATRYVNRLPLTIAQSVYNLQDELEAMRADWQKRHPAQPESGQP